MAAASALHAAGRGTRALLVSTDPAHSLGHVLRRQLGPAPRAAGRGLAAVELDAQRAVRRWLRPRRALLRLIAERGTYLAGPDLDALMEASLPGVGELIALIELRRLADGGRYDRVFVDTAPTGHTLRLLEMPRTLRQLARVLDDMQAKHRALGRALAGRHRADAADALIAELEREAEDLQALLRDPGRVAFSWILEPDELALAEAGDGVAALRAGRMLVDEVVVNGLTPPPPGPCRLCDPRRASQALVLERVRGALGACTLRTLDAQEQEPRGAAALARIGRALACPARARPGHRSRTAARARPAPRAPRSRAAWPDLLAPVGRRLVLFGGKGGVGKTSAAAAAALELAARGRRVLALSTDPAHSLGDALGVPLGDEETAVPGAPGMRAREIDAAAAYAARRERYRALVDEMFGGLRAAGVDAAYDRAVTQDLLDMAPPGIDELFALDALTAALADEAAAPAAADVVIVDTAPTGHALQLLATPEAVLAWLRTLLGILRRDRLAARMPDLAAELVALSRQVRGLLGLMRDPRRTAFVVVSRPAALPVLETQRLLDGLTALRVPVSALIVNALTPPEGCARCRRAARREARHLARLRRLIGASTRRSAAATLTAPLVAPAPRGADALREWAARWRILGA